MQSLYSKKMYNFLYIEMRMNGNDQNHIHLEMYIVLRRMGIRLTSLLASD